MKKILFLIIIGCFVESLFSCNNKNKPIVAKLFQAYEYTTSYPSPYEPLPPDPKNRVFSLQYLLVNPTSDTIFIPFNHFLYKSSVSVSIEGYNSVKPVIWGGLCDSRRDPNILYPKDTLMLCFIMQDSVLKSDRHLSSLSVSKIMSMLKVEFNLDSTDIKPKDYRVPKLIFENDTSDARIFNSEKEYMRYYKHF